MKIKSYLKLSVLLMALAGTSISCGDDKTPEIVENPLETVQYYVSGVVKDQTGTPIQGVEVVLGDSTAMTDALGIYSLIYPKTGQFVMSFDKTSYMELENVAVSIPTGTQNRSTVFVDAIMVKEGVAVTIDPTKDAVVSQGGANETNPTVSVTIPAGAITDPTDVSVTPYVSSGTSSSEAILTTFKIKSSSTITLAKDIEMDYRLPELGSSRVKKMIVRKRTETRVATNEFDAIFDEISKTYKIVFPAGSVLNGDYDFMPESTITDKGISTGETLFEDTKDNSGSLSAIKNYTINYQAKTGWEIKDWGGVSEIDKSIFTTIAQNRFNSIAGITNVSMKEVTDISGGNIFVFKCNAQINTITISLELINANGDAHIMTVTINKYTGVVVSTSNVSGSTHGGTAGS